MTTSNKHLTTQPDRLFEVSWEICNKVGGIHTVIATKARTMIEMFGTRYIAIGPDIHREGDNPEFEETTELWQEWKQNLLHQEGIRVRIGRWRTAGKPVTLLVDFSTFINQKNDILRKLWEDYHVDSISGQWDYIEPVLFGYAAGKTIESFCRTFCSPEEHPAAHFHEWMTASGGLYLRRFVPRIATLFTTHATVLGRCIAGNGLGLYGSLATFDPNDIARRFNVVAKHSIEKIAAASHDCFTTVSDITARECQYLLGKSPDTVTPNGFEDDFTWTGNALTDKRNEARQRLFTIAGACFGHDFPDDTLVVGTSGRFEFRNKGLDVFLDAMGQLSAAPSQRDILAVVAVPAGNNGPRKDLAAHLSDPDSPVDAAQLPFVTHYLSAPDDDPIARAIRSSADVNKADGRIFILYIPTYLDGKDGIVNLPYYNLLAGMDLTVFASYYEPWGYTPLESAAFSVPTVTTSLSGFGSWAEQQFPANCGIEVIPRNDDNDAEVTAQIAATIRKYADMEADAYRTARSEARQAAEAALWERLITHYRNAYEKALQTAAERNRQQSDIEMHREQINCVHQPFCPSQPTWTRLIVEVSLPERLRPLAALAKNLWWSWTLDAHELFSYIDPDQWEACSRNPITLLDQLSAQRLGELEKDPAFLERMDAVYADFQRYMARKAEQKAPKIAYFSMEYGLSHSLKIYSGGLGILAGDYLKEASDRNVPMVAVGLLYRYGYFTQRLSADGTQEAAYEAQDFNKLPIVPVRDEFGNWCAAQISFPGRTITARIWKCEVGRTDLYLLDTDHDLNLAEDRAITHHLYGGDWENRFRQEILLGIGGIRALDRLGIHADLFHCNEGHAAFIGIERLNKLIDRHRLTFNEALEVVRSSSLFTTHTPVPAGHDAFSEDLVRKYLSHYPDRLDISWEQFFNLGKANPQDHNEKFSMSVLASNLSQEVNGVSRLHGEVSRELLGNIWPGYFPDELHVGYVTNGVHFPTWAASDMRKLYARYFPEGFSEDRCDPQAWQKAKTIPDEEYWHERLSLKARLLRRVKEYVSRPEQSNLSSPQAMVKILESLDTDVLTIGFARRFATYKRANLLFTDLDRLSAIINNPERPVRFIFAGKAHPNDVPGQALIKRIIEVASMPQFTGKIIFISNYDMYIARRMVQGVDVWLNTPTRPLEASGTSGMKAAMNGVMQFSVLDGWWVEGYEEGAGWALPEKQTYQDPAFQNELDAAIIYRTIEEEIVPLYYRRGKDNIPHDWIAASKRCVADIASRFTTTRMLADYQERFYNKLYMRTLAITADGYAMARSIAAWKQRVSSVWDQVRIVSTQRFDIGRAAVVVSHPYHIETVIDGAGLSPDELGVEIVLAEQIESGSRVRVKGRIELTPAGQEGNLLRYALDYTPMTPGSFDVAIRVYPKNALLPHRMDFALVKWA